MFKPSFQDPFSKVFGYESRKKRKAREERERELLEQADREDRADRASNAIGEVFRQEAKALKKKVILKTILIGQADSGKSTILKNIEMKFYLDDWEDDRQRWSYDIRLNVLRATANLVRAVDAEISSSYIIAGVEDIHLSPLDERSVRSVQRELPFTDIQKTLVSKLAPLRIFEAKLGRQIEKGPEYEYDYPDTNSSIPAAPSEPPAISIPSSSRQKAGFSISSIPRPSIRFSLLWERPRRSRAQTEPQPEPQTHAPAPLPPPTTIETPIDCSEENIVRVLLEHKKGIQTLWADQLVRQAVRHSRIPMPESSGFFLDEIDRITGDDYRVEDNDILRARTRNFGVQEFTITIKPPRGPAWEWRLVDIGSRMQRTQWEKYFRDASVLILVFPVSAFDQRLEEDRNINRFEDSRETWKYLCERKVLLDMALVGLLNKCDVLHRKLSGGLNFKDYVPSYGDRPNDAAGVIKFLVEKLADTVSSFGYPRDVYIYPITATDTAATKMAMHNLYMVVQNEYLDSLKLM